MMHKTICILGSTGSIGTQALEVAEQQNFTVDAISADKNIDLLEKQIRKFSPKFCAVRDTHAAADLKVRTADTNVKIIDGPDSASILAQCTSAGTVLNSIIGFAGLKPTLEAIKNKKNIAIANKETLVSAGSIVMSEVKKTGVSFLPVDSEHCAIHQCLKCAHKSEVKKLLLTASGGPFFGKQKSFVYNATVDMALRHPNWSMGRKITIDSASLVNKGLELIEAMHLFDMPEDKIEIVVHRESVIHSMVQFLDNSVIAQLALPDMRLCIQYALLDGRKAPGQCPELDFSKLSSLTFSVPDNEVFPSINMARKAARLKGTYPCIFNSANEACVDLFLREKISFGDIFTLIGDALENVYAKTSGVSVEDIINTDIEARNFVYSKIK